MPTCDIFCNVIDNYGDIGVCWRLARILTHEHGLAVRLWVDDLPSFAILHPAGDGAADVQYCDGVEVRHWYGTLAGVQAAALVIEAFACRLPDAYIQAMLPQPPVWITLEYLSAEDWVESHHGLPSPHPQLPLTKHYFFPGFTRQTGGLLLEHDLLARRDAFKAADFWQKLQMDPPAPDTLVVSMFGYETPALPSLLNLWARGTQPVLCLVPDGRMTRQVQAHFGLPGRHFFNGRLEVRIIPFVPQAEYDELLWVSDINFVRGEDSCVRAQWAGKPFVWQIYPQEDGAHWPKLQAFLDHYHADTPELAAATQPLWQAWNSGSGTALASAWADFVAARPALDTHAKHWAEQLSGHNLALNLLDFCQKTGKIRAFQNSGTAT